MFAKATNDEQQHEKEVNDIEITDYCRCHGCEVKMFDTEKQNPRIKSDLYGSPDPMWELGSRFLSHGETIFPMVDAVKSMKDMVVFIDEPEAGVSLTNQKIISNSLLEAVKNKCQLIVATHSYVLIKNTEEVFDLEAREWVKSTDYLKKFDNE
jgi:predicted ATPase